MKITRYFTKAGHEPLEGIPFVPRTSRITKLDGIRGLRGQGRAGAGGLVPGGRGHPGPEVFPPEGHRCQQQRREGRAPGLPPPGGLLAPLGRDSTATSTRAEDAQAFYDELVYMLANQMCAPNSPQWFNTGLHFAYGISGPAQGHSYVDPKTGEMTTSTCAYERPQPHACFIQSVDDDLVNRGRHHGPVDPRGPHLQVRLAAPAPTSPRCAAPRSPSPAAGAAPAS